MPCRSSWFLPDCDGADASTASAAAADAAAPQDYAPRLPRPIMARNFRGVFDRATLADLAASRDSGAGLLALESPGGSATPGADRSSGSLLLPVLIIAGLIAFSR